MDRLPCVGEIWLASFLEDTDYGYSNRSVTILAIDNIESIMTHGKQKRYYVKDEDGAKSFLFRTHLIKLMKLASEAAQ